jgi:hypothetical protein
MNLLVEVPAAQTERVERQTHTQVPRSICCACAELPQINRMVIEAGDNFAVRVRFKRDVTADPSG